MIFRSLAIVTASLILIGCHSDLIFENAPGSVTSVGPVFTDGDNLVIHYSVYDIEGDLLHVVVEHQSGSTPIDGDWTATQATGDGVLISDDLLNVPSTADAFTPHSVLITSGIAVGQPGRVRLYVEGDESNAVVVEY